MRGNSSLRSVLLPLLAPVGVLALLFAVAPLELSQELENVTVDRRFKARESSDPSADPRILLVGIGEYSLKQVGRWEDWTREVHALFLDKLRLRPPAVVAYDFLFSENSRDPANDETFADQLALFPSAVTGAFVDVAGTDPLVSSLEATAIGNTKRIERFYGDYSSLLHGNSGALPVEIISQSSWTGFVNSPPSGVDGIRRRVPLVVGYGGHPWPSLVLQILIQLDGATPEGVEVKLGEEVVVKGREGQVRRIPIDEKGFMALNYRGKSAFDPVDYIELLQKLNEYGGAESWPETLPPVEGQILLVGQMAEGLSDFGPTPFSPQAPLVHVQAVALNNILQGDYLRFVPLWRVMLGWLPLAWGTLWFLRKAPVFWSAAIPVALVVAFVAASFSLFEAHSVQIPLFLPVLGFLLVHAGALVDRLVIETRAKSRIKNIFGTFAPPQVVEAIVASGEDPKLGGEEVEITAFFSDIQGFSTFSEKLAPEPLVVLMNEYLTAMTNVLMARRGSLDKYIGDAIVGIFGAPLPSPDHAHCACAATIDMQRKQAELREKWHREGGWPEIVHQMQTRIGLNTGPAVVGYMGSPRRMNYTMMGDTVNLAARCESGAKSYGVYTMVSGETRSAALEAKDDIAFRYLDKIVVKGRSRPVEMYEVMGFAADLTAEANDCIAIYLSGIEKYLARDWDGAKAAFEKSSRLEPFQPGVSPGVHDNPSLVMIRRCGEMKANPPGEDWDGRYVMTSK